MKPGIGGGDRGGTATLAGAVRKDECRVQALGDIDELNSLLGLARAQLEDKGMDAVLHRVQGELFAVGADLAGGGARMTAEHVQQLESELQRAEAELPELAHFIFPAGPGALLHVARAVCRRAERSAVALIAKCSVNPHAMSYLNRLSDVLFALARLAGKRAGASEEPWQPAAIQPSPAHQQPPAYAGERSHAAEERGG